MWFWTIVLWAAAAFDMLFVVFLLRGRKAA